MMAWVLSALLLLSLSTSVEAATPYDDTFSVSGTGCVGDCVVPAGSLLVRCDTGSDVLGATDGTTHATAYLTVAAARSTVTTSQDIYLYEGETCNEKVFGWSGTDSDRSVLGAYKLISGAPYIGLTDLGDLTNEDPGSRPALQGTLTPACMAAQTCDTQNSNAIPTTLSQGMVEADDIDYFTMQDLALTNSAGRFISADAGDPSVDTHYGLRILRMYMYYGLTNVVVEDGWKEVLIEDNLMYEYNVCESEQATWIEASCAFGASWPAGIAIFDSNTAYALIQGNRVYAGSGEAYSCVATTHCVFRNNVDAGHHSGSHYNNVSDYILVEGNVSAGNPSSEANAQPRDNRDFGGSVSGAEEGPHQRSWAPDNTDFNLVRNNIVVGRGKGFSLSPEAAIEDVFTITGQVYGNTFYGIDSRAADVNNKAGNNGEIRNNIFTTRGSEICREQDSPTLLWSHNYWDAQPTDVDCRGTGDVNGGSLNYPITEATADTIGVAAILGKSYATLITDYGVPGAGAASEGASVDLTTTNVAFLNAANWDWIPGYLGNEWRTNALETDIQGSTRCAGSGSVGAVETTSC